MEPLFASARERRLWRWTAAAVAAVYATLGLTAVLAEALYHPGLSAVAFLGGMALIGLAVLAQGLERRPGGLELGVGLGVAAVYAFLFVRMTIPERSHLIEYGVVAALAFEALTERRRQGRRVPAPALLAVLLASAVGALDEAVQLALPSRVFDPLDVLFNVLAAAAAVLAVALLRWARRRPPPGRAR